MSDPALSTPPPPPAAAPAAGFAPLALLRVLRPKQWTKNLALFAPLVFSLKLQSWPDTLHAIKAVVSFCLLAGSVYVFNDVADREKDRLHPEKRNRPIASGALPVPVALGWGAVCMSVALTLAWTVPNRGLLTADLTYLVMQVLYTFWLKQMAVVDVMVIALGFVIRVVAGAEAVDVPFSNWLLLCTLCLALFLGFCKRRHELLLLEEGAGAHRANLSDYSPALLDQLIGTTTAMTLMSYALYTMSPETAAKFGNDHLKFTIPFAVYGVFRYLFLVYKRAQGGSPERILLSDNPMRWTVVGYVLTVLAVLYR